MFDQLQQALDKYQELEAQIQTLEARNLELVEERDQLKEKAVANEKFERQASHAVALENKVIRLVYQVEKANVIISAQGRELTQLKSGENPKKLKEANKRLKTKNKELTDGLALIKQENKAYARENRDMKKEIESLNIKLVATNGTFREFGDYQVMLWPAVMGVERNRTNKVEKLLAVLVMNPAGTGTLVTVKDGVACIPEEYKLITDSYEPLPDDVLAFVEGWLGKVEGQGYNYTDADLLAFSNI